jgi:hypothetical protein
MGATPKLSEVVKQVDTRLSIREARLSIKIKNHLANNKESEKKDR